MAGSARWLSPWLLAVAGCGGAHVTFLDVKVLYDADVVIDQIRFEVQDGGQRLIAPTTRPDPAGAVLASGQGIDIVLPDTVNGHRLTATVTGLRGGQELFHGAADAIALAGVGVEVPIALGAKANQPPDVITVMPGTSSLAAGGTVRLTASGSFSDGSMRDVTQKVSWQSMNALVASVDGAGLVTAQKPGMTGVTATWGGAHGSATIMVTNATLMSIEVTPPDQTIHPLGMQQFAALGHYSDGTTQPVTSQASWSSSSGTVASVSDQSGSKGLATGVAPGSTTITASFSGMKGTAALKVQ